MDMDAVRAAVNVSPLSKEAARGMLVSAEHALDLASSAASVVDSQRDTIGGEAERQAEKDAIVNLRDKTLPTWEDPLEAQHAELVRSTVLNAFTELDAVQEGIGATDDISSADTIGGDIGDAVKEAPAVFGDAVGKVAAGVAGAAGNAAGAAAGSFLNGLMANTAFLLFAAGAVIYFMSRRK